MLFNFSIQTKHFITKKSKFFKKMNCFIKILYLNTLLIIHLFSFVQFHLIVSQIVSKTHIW